MTAVRWPRMQSGHLIEALYAIGIGMVVGLEREHSEVADGLADTRPLPGEIGPEANERVTLNLTLTGKRPSKDLPPGEKTAAAAHP